MNTAPMSVLAFGAATGSATSANRAARRLRSRNYPVTTLAPQAQPITLLPTSMSRTCVSLFLVWQHRRGWPNRTCPVFVAVAFEVSVSAPVLFGGVA